MGFLRMLLSTLSLIFGNCCFVYPQNLVENPSFETFLQCPMKLGNLEQDVVSWKAPTLGSTDYFNGCSQAMGTPKNFNGEQPAEFGVGYVGFYMLAPDDYREYVQASLKATLKQGERYTISFYVSLAERSDFAIKEFGILFSEFPIAVETNKTLSNMHLSRLRGDTSNRLEITYSKFYSDETDWIFITQDFVANGTENYMIIGNFKDNKRTQRYQTKRNITKGSYYYLDMVSVQKTDSSEINPDTTLTTNFELDSVHVFKEVFFDFNKTAPKVRYQKELHVILDYLQLHPNLKIRISGHTDNVGSDSFNQELSVKRANAVANYLITNGVLQNRIEHEGFGSSKPISSNKTKAGRLRNRRVEFVLLE